MFQQTFHVYSDFKGYPIFMLICPLQIFLNIILQ